MARACKYCGSEFHAQTFCFLKPKKPIAVKNYKPLKRTPLARSTKPIRQKGRVGKATDAAVKAWEKTQKPNHANYYICHYCQAWVTYLMAEHMESKVRRPDLRTVAANYVPVCSSCNEKKRSKSHDEIPHDCNLV